MKKTIKTKIFKLYSQTLKCKMEKVIVSFTFFISIISCVHCEKTLPGVENLGALFDTIKDAGLVDKFAEKFGELLADKKLAAEESKNHMEKSEFDLFEFCKEYSEEKFKMYNEKAIFYLSKIEVDLRNPVNVVKLTSVLDSLGKLTILKQKSVNDKAVEIMKRGKSLQALKISLDKLQIGTGSPFENKLQKPKEKTFRANTEVVREKTPPVDPRVLVKNLPTELRKYIEQIREDPSWIIDYITSTISSYDLVSDKTIKMLEMYSKLFTQTEYFQYALDMILDFLEDLSKSELVRKVFAVLPGLLEAEDLGELVEVIDDGLDINLNSFVDLVDQYGMQEYVSEFVAAFLQAAIQAVHETVNDNMRVTMLNTFLLTQDLPAINVRKLTQSSLKILSKLTNYVSTWKVDAKKLEKLVNDFVFEFEKNYLPIEKLLQQDEREQLKHISKFIQESVAGPLKLLIKAHGHLYKKDSDNKSCSPYLLCSLNQHVKVTNPRLNSIILSRFSLLAAWGWSFNEAFNYTVLHKAVFKGLKQEDCDNLYKSGPDCRIFPWQKDVPNHTEL